MPLLQIKEEKLQKLLKESLFHLILLKKKMMISLQEDLLTESLKLVQQEARNHLSLRKVKLLEIAKVASFQKNLLLIRMTEERLLLKMIPQRSLDLSQTTLQSTLFHTQIFALRKKVSLLIKAML